MIVDIKKTVVNALGRRGGRRETKDEDGGTR